jgi:hypothetical protein
MKSYGLAGGVSVTTIIDDPCHGWHTLRACGCAWLASQPTLILKRCVSTALRECASDDGAR